MPDRCIVFHQVLKSCESEFLKKTHLKSSTQPIAAVLRRTSIVDKTDPNKNAKKLEVLVKIVLLVIFLIILWATGTFVLNVLDG
jgi:hypothetical protein